MLHRNLVGGLTVSAVSCFLDLLQKLRIQIGCRRNGRIIVTHEAGRTNIQCHRHSRCTYCCIAFGVVAEYRHFGSPHMKLRRQIQGRAVHAKHDVVCLIALRELHHLVKTLPVAVKGELELHILDLVVGKHLTLQHLNALVLYKEFPHYSCTSVHSWFSASHSINPSRHCIRVSPDCPTSMPPLPSQLFCFVIAAQSAILPS